MLGVLGDLTEEPLDAAASTDDPVSKAVKEPVEPNEETPKKKSKSTKLPAANSPTARPATSAQEKTADQSCSKEPQQSVDGTTFKLPPKLTKKAATKKPLEAITEPPKLKPEPCSNSATGKENKTKVQPGDVKLYKMAGWPHWPVRVTSVSTGR